jgi:hypothetical protein
MKKPLITLMLLATGAISLQATAQTKAEFDELRQEVMRLRQEINAQKAATSAAPSAASAGMVDRLDQVEIKQKDAVVLGDIGGSFRLPGSETSVKLYGFAELNMVREGKGDNSGNDYSTFVPYAPLNGTNARKGQTYLHARTSRFGVETSTPTAYGPLGIKIEGDFNNEPRTGNSAVYGGLGNIYTQQATNSYGFRLRQAYGTVGGFTAGQTWSTFMDVDNSPENVDFNGPIGSTFVRQPLVKYAYGTQESGTFTFAAENPVSYILDSTSGTALTSGFSKLPDLVARWDKSYDWGSVSTRGVTLEHRLQDATSGLAANKRGFGLGATAFIKTREAKDFLSLALTYGKGIGRYFNYIEGAIYDPAANAILLEKAVGLVAGYQYKHSDTFRANFVLGYQKNLANEYTAFVKTAGLGSGQYGVNKSAYQAHIGFIYNPIKGVDLGAEYIIGQRTTLVGEKGDLSRINLSAKYNF